MTLFIRNSELSSLTRTEQVSSRWTFHANLPYSEIVNKNEKKILSIRQVLVLYLLDSLWVIVNNPEFFCKSPSQTEQRERTENKKNEEFDGKLMRNSEIHLAISSKFYHNKKKINFTFHYLSCQISRPWNISQRPFYLSLLHIQYPSILVNNIKFHLSFYILQRKFSKLRCHWYKFHEAHS